VSTTTRRGFLKGLGATFAAVGLVATPLPGTGSIAASALVDAGDGAGEQSLISLPVAAEPEGIEETNRVEREMLSSGELEMLIAERLGEWVASGRGFTAYDITRALRRSHPQVNIMHQSVRAVVHPRMQPLVAHGLYDQELVAFATGDAWRYRPID
jgi:hypothetical protein